MVVGALNETAVPTSAVHQGAPVYGSDSPALNVCQVCSKPKAEHGQKVEQKYVRNTGLPQWHVWRAFRRGLATNLHRLGVDDRTIWQSRRSSSHSNVAVTQACYISTASEQTQVAMQKFEEALIVHQVFTGRVLKMKSGRN